MKRRLSLALVIATTILAITPSIQPSHANDCINYWLNPNTGQQECLDQNLQIIQSPAAPNRGTSSPSPAATSDNRSHIAPRTFDFSKISDPETRMEGFLHAFARVNPDGSTTGFIDDLKNCTAYSVGISESFSQGVTITRSVVGDRYGNCIVTLGVITPALNGEEIAARCQFSPASIEELIDKHDIGRRSTIFEKECREIQSFAAETPSL